MRTEERLRLFGVEGRGRGVGSSGLATRWPIAQSEAYGQTIRQRPKRPRFQKHPG